MSSIWNLNFAPLRTQSPSRATVRGFLVSGEGVPRTELSLEFCIPAADVPIPFLLFQDHLWCLALSPCVTPGAAEGLNSSAQASIKHGPLSDAFCPLPGSSQ